MSFSVETILKLQCKHDEAEVREISADFCSHSCKVSSEFDSAGPRVAIIRVTFHFQSRSIHSTTLSNQHQPERFLGKSFYPPGGNFGSDMSVIFKLYRGTFTTHSEIRFGFDLIADGRKKKKAKTRFSLFLWTLSTACGDDYLIKILRLRVKDLETVLGWWKI